MTNNSNTNVNQDYQNNINLSYDYIEKSLKDIKESDRDINTQLGLLIGFNFTFIRFFINDLPSMLKDDSLSCNSCLILKILAYTFSFASIIFCFLGLYKTIKYYIIPPHLLLENCDKVPNYELRLAILDTWEEKLKNFTELTKQKKQLLNKAIALLLVSGLMAIFDDLIVSIFS